MNHNHLIIFTLLFVGLIAGFGWYTAYQQIQINRHRPSIAATIYPLYDIVRTIGGPELPIDLLTPPGSQKMKSTATYKLIFSTTNLKAVDAKVVTFDRDYLDLANAAYYLDTVAGALSAHDPAHATDFYARAAIFKQQLLELVAQYPTCDYHQTVNMDPIGGSIDKDTFLSLMKSNLELVCKT